MERRFLSVVLVVLLFGMGTPIFAANWTDASGVDHLWSTAGNWDTGVPTLADNAIIDLPGQPCSITAAVTAQAAVVQIGQSGTGQLDMTGGSLDLGGGSFTVGQGACVGTFNMSSGLTKYGTMFIGEYGGEGTVNLSGDAHIQGSGNILVGGRSSGTGGTMNITDSAWVQTPYLAVAQDIPGTLNLSGSGKITARSGGGSIIWMGIAGDATVNIGPGTTVDADQIYIPAGWGTSNVYITGGNFTLNMLTIGQGAAGMGTVHMTGGSIKTDNLWIGRVGMGHLQLDGGTVNAGNLDMNFAGGNETIDITGGSLILPGVWDQTKTEVANGWITAYGGTGFLVFSYNAVTTKTTITATTALVWTDAKIPADHLWSSAANWGGNAVPNSTSNVLIALPANPCLINSTVTADCNSVTIGAGATAGHLNMTGGSFTCTQAMMVSVGDFHLSSGSATMMALAVGPQGHVQLDGGSLNAITGTLASGATLDLTAGTLIINGDATAALQGYINAGNITAYAVIAGTSNGNVLMDYNVSHSGKTTLKACRWPVGDLTKDCEVNLSDLAVLAAHWLENTNP
jgi:hypothetical protein